MWSRGIRQTREPRAGGLRHARGLVAASMLALSTRLARADSDPASLDRLHDIVSPPPISWWPVAPGWIGLAVLAGVLIVALLWRARRRSLRDRYRHEALAELARLRAASQPLGVAVAERMVLLKRTALSAYPRADVASLSGPAWWRYLDERNETAHFAEGLGAACDALAYREAPADEPAALELATLDRAVEDWIRKHRPAPSPDLPSTNAAAPARVEATGGA